MALSYARLEAGVVTPGLHTFALRKRVDDPAGPSRVGHEGVGSGLGRVICVLLVRALGGNIGVHSELGNGTCMIFSISAQASHADGVETSLLAGGITSSATVCSFDTALRNAIKDHGPSVTTEAAPLLDQATLNSLSALEKRAAEPFLSSLIDRFLKGMPDEVARVRAEWLADDLEKTEAAAHALAGAAATVGAGALSRAARCMSESPQDFYMAELTGVAARTEAALTTWRNDVAASIRASPA